MKHPFWDRILMLITAAVCIAAAAGIVMLILGKFSLGQVTDLLGRIDFSRSIVKAIGGAAAAVCALFGVFMLSMMTPARKKKSSNFAIQRNENGMVRISLKALETLVNKVLNQHAELKVVTSSLFSDEETIRVDVHIALQSDISMPLAISSLQKQIKRYIEACSGVQVSEVRIFVDSTLPSDENAAKSPYAIPESLLKGTDALSEGHPEEEPASPPKSEPVPEVKPEPDPEPASAPGKAEFGQSDFMREAYAPKSEPAPAEEADEAEEEAEAAEAETEAETGEAPAEESGEEPEYEEEPEPAGEPEEEDEFAAEPEDEEEPEFEENSEPAEGSDAETEAEESVDTEEPEELLEEEYPEEVPATEEQPEEELPEEDSAFGGNYEKKHKAGESAFGADAEGTGDAL
ncbi:MAG: alkaline shock response membrane anchor protein AmaP [Clostridiales bacterium]|nr:alkaline shock response membrane anchor protein AmaP [Clostridiales bacterium]